MASLINENVLEVRAQLFGSFLLFCKVFFPKVTGREFLISQPLGRESHFVTISKELTKVARMETTSLLINVPPGSGKSTLLALWVAWTLARYKDSQYLYVSYGHELAAKHTEFIRRIIQNSHYRALFDIDIRHDMKAKDHFMTTTGASIKAFGSSGPITGQDAGLPNCDHFSGCVIIDDAHKPDEVHSDTIRQRVIDNYQQTIIQRPRGPNVPIIFIGQRLHEDDLPAFMLSGKDERTWHSVVLKSIDDAGNALYPEVNPLQQLLEKKEKNSYVFSSQFQQEPVPSGGALFKAHQFILLEEEPKILQTFITADTAETSKSYNDATVFSFWGIYKILSAGQETGQLGLHWIDCVELRVEPKDLRDEFLSFYSDCMLHPIKPLVAAIEKKSTGVTLLSVLQDMRGLEMREVKRTKASGSKTERYLEMQPIIAAKLVSFTSNAKHVSMCLRHMEKITANQSHRHDDVCFVAGTLIATVFGYKAIESINKGDLLITPMGIGRVFNCGKTRNKTRVIERHGLRGTSDHPIFLKEVGFVPLSDPSSPGYLSKISRKEFVAWGYKKLLCLMDSNIDLWERKDITLVSQKRIKEGRILKDFMWRFGNFIATRQFLKGMLFITKMATILITVITILSVFRTSNICRLIKIPKLNMVKVKNAWKILGKPFSKLQNGTEVLKGEISTESMPWSLLPSAGSFCAQSVQRNFPHDVHHQNTIPKNVSELKTPEKPGKEEGLKDVYNLTVEKYGVYYANDVLVSNCDTLYDACKIGLIDKTLYVADLHNRHSAVTKSLAQDSAQKLAARKAALMNKASGNRSWN